MNVTGLLDFMTFLTGEACSTCTAVCAGGGVCVCHYKKCDWSLQGISSTRR